MSYTSADVSGIGFNDSVLETKSRENSFVSVVHQIVTFSGSIEVDVKTVCVFHDEFATAHQTKSRPDFISVLCLNLVKIFRQIAITLNVFADNICDNFFVSGTEAERM